MVTATALSHIRSLLTSLDEIRREKFSKVEKEILWGYIAGVITFILHYVHGDSQQFEKFFNFFEFLQI